VGGARLQEKALQVGALEVGTALGRVLEHTDDLEVAGLREGAATTDLVVDGARILSFGRVASVDGDRGMGAGIVRHRVHSFLVSEGWPRSTSSLRSATRSAASSPRSAAHLAARSCRRTALTGELGGGM
jgi:hypothetical protein